MKCIICEKEIERSYGAPGCNGAYCAACASVSKFSAGRFRINPQLLEPRKIKDLLGTPPAIGVERIATETRTRIDEQERKYFVEQCVKLDIDPDALLKTAKKNAALMAELSHQQDRVTRALREVKAYLVNIFDEWRAMTDDRKYELANMQVYNHVRAELDDLEELAKRYEVDLDGEARP